VSTGIGRIRPGRIKDEGESAVDSGRGLVNTLAQTVRGGPGIELTIVATRPFAEVFLSDLPRE
jgi:hypothetical protein